MVTGKWHPTPVLLPGKSHGRKSLVGYSPWGHQELDTTERLHMPAKYNHSSLYAKEVFTGWWVTGPQGDSPVPDEEHHTPTTEGSWVWSQIQ